MILSILSTIESNADNTSNRDNVTKVPRLVVNIAIDQLRSELLDEYMPLFSNNGFYKLFNMGRVYRNATMPFYPVDRAAAIASISTGSYPYYNGIPSSGWISRKTLQPMFCTADQVSLLTPRSSTPSPINLKSSTLSDELKICTNGMAKVYNIALDSDAAIMFAGYSSDCATWIDFHTGLWTTSSYYNDTQPQWISTYNTINDASNKLKSRVYTFKGDEKLIQVATDACKVACPDVNVHVGRVLTGDQFISDKTVKNDLISTYDGYCCEMEGAAIAHAAYLNSIPFLIIRAISDKADDSASMDYPTFEAMAIENSVKLMKEMIKAI